MTYFEAKHIEKQFRIYRQLVIEYWNAVEPTNPTRMAGPGAKLFSETQNSAPLREKITWMVPQMEHWADRVGASVTGLSYPAPAVGGPVIPFNLLGHVTDLWIGHKYVEQQTVLDAIDRCIGAAQFHKRRTLARMLKPWCWLVDVPALIIGWPFAVMRKAGVPDSIVESKGANVLKALFTAAIWLAGLVFAIYRTGLAAALQDVLSAKASRVN